MEHMKYWSRATNPETGAWFEWKRGDIETAQNDKGDMSALIDSEYGAHLTEEMHIQQKYSNPSPEKEAYLNSFGIRHEIHDNGEYYKRWQMFIPEEIKMCASICPGRKFPLIFLNAGFDSAHFEFGLYKFAAREQFMYVNAQDATWDSVSRILEAASKLYPVDTERVYAMGFSAYGHLATSAATHYPWKFAGIAPCGNDISRTFDSLRRPYTEDEYNVMRAFVVPFIQVLGTCDANNILPHNDFHPREKWGGLPMPEELKKQRYVDSRMDERLDPTIPDVRRRPDGSIQNTPPSTLPHPAEGEDPHIWSLERFNRRMELLRCEPRDIEKCLSYLDHPEDELHHVLGFYGDREEIRTIYGLKHYCVDIMNADGINAFRYIVLENHPHQIPVTAGEFVWDFFKRFRRSKLSGKIVEEEYVPSPIL